MYKDFFMHICKICNTEFKTLDQLRRHSGRIHKITAQQLYNEVVLNNTIPKCKCGCDEIPTFISFTHGYKEWIRGHISKIKNNWGHNQTAIDNSSKTRKEQFEKGERSVWNIGLTKETDIRVKKYSENGKQTIINNPAELKRRSEWMSNARNNKKEFQTKWGKEAANWKGGTSSINNLVRANKRLYTEWVYPILKQQNFTCQSCSSTKQLQVHHNEETMSEIIAKYVDKTKDYTFDEKREIMNMVIDYHINNDISGNTLCKTCHSELHPSYNI
jgi:hypothetical protein